MWLKLRIKSVDVLMGVLEGGGARGDLASLPLGRPWPAENSMFLVRPCVLVSTFGILGFPEFSSYKYVRVQQIIFGIPKVFCHKIFEHTKTKLAKKVTDK